MKCECTHTHTQKNLYVLYVLHGHQNTSGQNPTASIRANPGLKSLPPQTFSTLYTVNPNRLQPLKPIPREASGDVSRSLLLGSELIPQTFYPLYTFYTVNPLPSAVLFRPTFHEKWDEPSPTPIKHTPYSLFMKCECSHTPHPKNLYVLYVLHGH